jgi:hypothetical protein
MTEVLNREILTQRMVYLPSSSLRPGMLLAVLVNFRGATFWDRTIILRQTMTGYIVFLLDWGIETQQTVGSIRLLPHTFAMMAPWAQEDSPTRRAGPSEPNAETSYGQTYYVEPTERIYVLRGPFSRRIYVRKVAVGLEAGRIAQRRRRIAQRRRRIAQRRRRIAQRRRRIAQRRRRIAQRRRRIAQRRGRIAQRRGRILVADGIPRS